MKYHFAPNFGTFMTFWKGGGATIRRGRLNSLPLRQNDFFRQSLFFFPVRLHAIVPVNAIRIAEVGHVGFCEGR